MKTTTSRSVSMISPDYNPSTYTVLRKCVDTDGHVMLNFDGRPLVEVDHWASFWNGWPSNIPIVAAIFPIILGGALDSPAD